MKRTLLSTLIAGLGLALSGGAQAAISDGVVKIGVLNDMSGPYADLAGPGSVVAAKMAVEDYLKQTGSKLKIEIVSADHQNKPDVGSSIARKWIDSDGVDMILDVPTSSVALAVAQVVKEKNKLMVNSTGGSSDLTGKACTPNTVHWTYDTWMLAHGTGSAVVKNGGDTWFFITADYAFGHALEKDARAIVEAQGGQALGSVKHPVGTSDMSSYLLQAQNSKAQVIGLANSGADTLNTVKQAREFGLGVGANKQVFTPLLALITEVNGMGLQNAQGMFITTGFYWDQDEQTRAFSRRYFERMKKMPTMMQAAVYSAVLHYLKAIKAAGTDDAQAVMARMKTTEVNDAVVRKGRIRDDGRLVHDMLLVQVKTPAESTKAWDLYKIRQVIPGEQAFQPLALSRCPLIKK